MAFAKKSKKPIEGSAEEEAKETPEFEKNEDEGEEKKAGAFKQAKKNRAAAFAKK